MVFHVAAETELFVNDNPTEKCTTIRVFRGIARLHAELLDIDIECPESAGVKKRTGR